MISDNIPLGKSKMALLQNSDGYESWQWHCLLDHSIQVRRVWPRLWGRENQLFNICWHFFAFFQVWQRTQEKGRFQTGL